MWNPKRSFLSGLVRLLILFVLLDVADRNKFSSGKIVRKLFMAIYEQQLEVLDDIHGNIFDSIQQNFDEF